MLRLESQWQDITKGVQKAQKLSKRYEQLIKELGKPLSSFDAGSMSAKFMEKIEKAFSKSNLKVETMQPMPWQVLPEKRCIRLAVQISAVTTQPTLNKDLQDLIELMLSLRSIRPPTLVERLNIKPYGRTETKLRLQMQLAWFLPVGEEVLKNFLHRPRRAVGFR